MNIRTIYHQGARCQTWNWDKICILNTFTHDGLDCRLANWLCPLWLSNRSWWNRAKVAITGFTDTILICWHVCTVVKTDQSSSHCRQPYAPAQKVLKVMELPDCVLPRPGRSQNNTDLPHSFSLPFLFSTFVTRRCGPVGGTRSSRKWKPGWINQLPEDTTITMTSHTIMHIGNR